MMIKKEQLVKGITKGVKAVRAARRAKGNGKAVSSEKIAAGAAADEKLITQVLTEDFLEALNGFIGEMVIKAIETKSDVKVNLIGGTLKVVFRPARKAINPKDQSPVDVDDRVQLLLRTKPKSISAIV